MKGPTLNAVGWARFVWRQLTSMRTALLLLMLLAVAAVPGSIVPQRSIDPAGVAQLIRDRPELGRYLDMAGMFNVYSSPWFAAIYLLLFISLIGCVIPRAKVYAHNVRKPPVKTPAHLDKFTHVRRVPGGDVTVEQIASVLRKARYRVRVDDADPRGASVSAERGYLRELGNLVFHVALIGVLVGMAWGSLLGYRAQVLVVEGQTISSTPAQLDSYDPGALVSAGDVPRFRLTLNSFAVEFESKAGGNQFGEPRAFSADVTVVDTDGVSRGEKILVNKPLRLDGASMFLSGNGYAPVVTVRDGEGNVAFRQAVPFLAQDSAYTSRGVIKVPDAKPQQIGIQGLFLPTAAPNGELRSIFPSTTNPELVITAFLGDLGLNSGVPQSVFRLNTDKMRQLTMTNAVGGDVPFAAKLRLGQTVELPNGAGSVTFEELPRFVALTMHHDPGQILTLVSAMVSMIGLVGSLFVRRRRVWARVVSDDDGTTIQWAALTKDDDPRLEQHLDDLIETTRR